MKCHAVMTPNPTVITPSATAQAAALIMAEEDVGIVPVVDSQSGRLVGVVTDRDLCLEVIAAGRSPQNAKVGESVHSNVVTCSPDDDVEACLALMQRHQLRRIPVVDEYDRCVGIISQKDVALLLNEPLQLAATIRHISRPLHTV